MLSKGKSIKNYQLRHGRAQEKFCTQFAANCCCKAECKAGPPVESDLLLFLGFILFHTNAK